MKTWKQALALVLALVMALSLVALPERARWPRPQQRRWASAQRRVAQWGFGREPRRPHRRGHWHGNEQDPAAER